jgi:hypothetical protein
MVSGKKVLGRSVACRFAGGGVFIELVVGIGWGRLLLGVMAASLAATIAFPVCMVLLAGVVEGAWNALGPVENMLPGLLALLPFGLVWTLVGGLPVHLLLAALRRQGWGAYALGGALGGGGLLFAFVGWPHWQEPIYLLGAISGSSGGLAFRAIWRPLINPAQPPRP